MHVGMEIEWNLMLLISIVLDENSICTVQLEDGRGIIVSAWAHVETISFPFFAMRTVKACNVYDCNSSWRKLH